MKMVSLVGFAGSGKSTAAMVFANAGYVHMSFADSLKDCVASIFCWERRLLQGDTDESRIFRETVDDWWAEKLQIPHFTPRFAMQNFGTETMRYHFNDNIWMFNVERKIIQNNIQAAVFADVRHPSEIAMTKRLGGKLILIKRGKDPDWYEFAIKANQGDEHAKNIVKSYNIHDSEMAWIGEDFDITIENNGTVTEFLRKIETIVESV